MEGQEGDGAAGEEARGHSVSDGRIVLVEAVEDADDLEDAESREGDEGDALVGLFAPDGDDLGDEEEGVADESEAEEEGDEFLHIKWLT